MVHAASRGSASDRGRRERFVARPSRSSTTAKLSLFASKATPSSPPRCGSDWRRRDCRSKSDASSACEREPLPAHHELREIGARVEAEPRLADQLFAIARTERADLARERGHRLVHAQEIDRLATEEAARVPVFVGEEEVVDD